ncbi:MAG: PAS domain-containing protein, partial [Erysipelotrichaceae bacterium]
MCGIVLVDEETRRIVYTNRVAKQLTQWDDTEMLGGICYEFLCPATADHCPLMDQHQAIEFNEKILTVKLGNPIPILKRVR